MYRSLEYNGIVMLGVYYRKLLSLQVVTLEMHAHISKYISKLLAIYLCTVGVIFCPYSYIACFIEVAA